MLAALAFMHLMALHQNASNNPMGVSSKLDRVPFYPYYVFKDLVGFFAFFLILSIFVFFFPNALGQWAAVLWSNPEYYDSTMCWNRLFLLDTRDVRGDSVAVVSFPVKIPQRVKSESAGNQKDLENVENLFDLDQSLVESSETIRASSSNVDEDFGYWLAGLIDGDGCLTFNGNVCRCEITLDAKDIQTLHKIKSKLGG